MRDRAHPGALLQEGANGDIGLDRPSVDEYYRRHPTASRLPELDRVDSAQYGVSATPASKARNANWARSVYADIWNASGSYRLPADVALVNFDTAVQHGPGVAAQLLRASGGDAQRYLALREQRYRDLMTGPDSTKPVGDYREVPAEQAGWLGQRMPALRAAVAAMK